jgi:NUMOD4 motif/NUMOD1 domain
MKGEKWKEISGFEDYYEASNYGRIKSLDREIPHPRLYKQFVKGQILSQSIARNKNILTGEASVDLRVSLAKDNVPYYFNTRRIIYSTFIKEIDYVKDGLYVINKNGDGFDCSVKNLLLITKSEKQNRAIARGRVDFSFLKTIDRSTWKKNYSRRKPVTQYDLKGKLIGKYKSIKEASEKKGFGQKEIISVAKGKYQQWSGFRWKYEKIKDRN